MQDTATSAEGPATEGHECPEHPCLTHDLAVLLRFHQGQEVTGHRALDLLRKLGGDQSKL